MIHSVSRPHGTVAPLDDAPSVLGSVSCPMCHTGTSLTQTALDAGGAWRCGRCGQQWDGARLTAVAAYATWVADRDRAQTRP